MYMFIYVYRKRNIYIYGALHIYIYTSIDFDRYINIDIHMYTHVCIYPYIYIHICIDIYWDIDIYMYLYIWIYWDLYIYRERESDFCWKKDIFHSWTKVGGVPLEGHARSCDNTPKLRCFWWVGLLGLQIKIAVSSLCFFLMEKNVPPSFLSSLLVGCFRKCVKSLKTTSVIDN